MHINSCLLNSQEELEELFRETKQKILALCASGEIQIDDASIRKAFERVVAGVHLFMEFGFSRWWVKIREGEIDVGDPARAPFNLVVSRFGLQIKDLPDRKAQDCGLVPIEFGPTAERRALNAFWNAVLADFKNDPVANGHGF
ncbi:MAG TPA: hypothetical protein VHE10_03425 [Candidatus Paceibacterota bacterium]|nr:hypothetical protein [Candidatus Paceibacterota bacterium]